LKILENFEKFNSNFVGVLANFSSLLKAFLQNQKKYEINQEFSS